MNNSFKLRGFTLVEILIVIVIISILTSLAAVSYRQYIVKSRRTAVQEEMLQYQQSMEEYYAINHTYASGGTCAQVGPWTKTANSGFYTINCSLKHGYRIDAKAEGNQATDDNDCKFLYLYRNGQRGGTSTGINDDDPNSSCW